MESYIKGYAGRYRSPHVISCKRNPQAQPDDVVEAVCGTRTIVLNFAGAALTWHYGDGACPACLKALGLRP